jgi:hypothetical protein
VLSSFRKLVRMSQQALSPPAVEVLPFPFQPLGELALLVSFHPGQQRTSIEGKSLLHSTLLKRLFKRRHIRLDLPAQAVLVGFQTRKPVVLAQVLEELAQVVAGSVIGFIRPEEKGELVAAQPVAVIGQVGQELKAPVGKEIDGRRIKLSSRPA